MGGAGAIWGGLTTVDLLHQCAPLEAVAEFVNSAAARMPAWVLLVRWRKGKGRERRGGGGKVSQLKGLIGTLGLWQHNDVGLLTLFNAAKNMASSWY